MLLAITFRPEFEPPRSGCSHIERLVLNRLGERDGEALVRELGSKAALTTEIVADIVDRTDLVPLFVKGSTKTVRRMSE